LKTTAYRCGEIDWLSSDYIEKNGSEIQCQATYRHGEINRLSAILAGGGVDCGLGRGAPIDEEEQADVREEPAMASLSAVFERVEDSVSCGCH